MNLGKLREMVRVKEAWHAAVQGVTELDVTGQLNNNNIYKYVYTIFYVYAIDISHKKEWNLTFVDNMDGPKGIAKWNKSSGGRNHIISLTCIN